MTAAQVIADALVSAERERKPIVPFTRAQPFLGTGTAYEAQSLFVGHRLADGERVIGAVPGHEPGHDATGQRGRGYDPANLFAG